MLAGRLAQINVNLPVKTDTTKQLERFKQAVLECLDVQELVPLVLNKMIEQIEIGSLEVVDSHKQKEITIVWRLTGKVQRLFENLLGKYCK